MRSGTILTGTAFAVLFSAVYANIARAVPLVEYSQDGKHFSILHLVSAHNLATAYYDYYKGSGHPGFGVAANTVRTAVYWDTDTKKLSLMVIEGARTKGSGSVSLNVTGLPKTSRLGLADDPSESVYHDGSSTLAASFAYTPTHTEGAVIDGLEAAQWTTKVSLKSIKGLTAAQVVDGDPTAGGVFRPLDLSKPLYITSFPNGGKHGSNSLLASLLVPYVAYPHTVDAANVGDSGNPITVGSGVTPEPASMAVWGILAIVLTFRPRRRTRSSV